MKTTNENVTVSKEELVHTVDSLKVEITKLKEKTFTKKELQDEMEKVMLNFLIYEDDLDRGKISLSGIKDKIEENDGL